jgi:hypothetical protein
MTLAKLHKKEKTPGVQQLLGSRSDTAVAHGDQYGGEKGVRTLGGDCSPQRISNPSP